jgi:hypothetical protein
MGNVREGEDIEGEDSALANNNGLAASYTSPHIRKNKTLNAMKALEDTDHLNS